ncbi:MAG: ImmA/IrrE family metallo-endopeptidase [Pseudomonadota bacterium]
MGMLVDYSGGYPKIEELAGKIRGIAETKLGRKNLRARELLEWVVRKLGGKIEIAAPLEHPEQESGSLEIRGKGDFTIWLSPYTAPLRDNFTIAHELGHYFLHYDPSAGPADKPVRVARNGTGTREWQANRFAAAFLMPQEQFTEKYHSTGGNIYAVAGHFEVSELAAEVRARYIIKPK